MGDVHKRVCDLLDACDSKDKIIAELRGEVNQWKEVALQLEKAKKELQAELKKLRR